VALLGGIGLMLALFGRYYQLLGWHGAEDRRLRFLPPGEVPLTPSQRSTAWYFCIVAATFLVQTLLGGATARCHAETGGFFGMDLAQWLPYNLTRTWRLQLALFFVSAAYVAAGIFLAPIIAGRKPRGQRALSCVLLAAPVVVVVGSLAGEAASYKGWLPADLKPTVGAQRWEYLDLGKLWQVLLVAGLVLWCAILFRGLCSRLAGDSRGNAGGRRRRALPAPVGGAVPGVGGLLEFPGCGRVWLPHQPAGRQLLRDWHTADGQ
jgi:nitric oxide reductase subunit B